MMKTEEINDLCKEVLTYLAYFKKELLLELPDYVLKKLKNYAAESNKDFYIDKDKKLEDQEISEDGKNLIGIIYYRYMANDENRRELLKLWETNE